jgi:hypothetical protein
MRLQNPEHAEELNTANCTLLKRTTVTTADEIIGTENRTRRSYWFDDECAEATTEKNKAYREMIKNATPGTQRTYIRKTKDKGKRFIDRKRKPF